MYRFIIDISCFLSHIHKFFWLKGTTIQRNFKMSRPDLNDCLLFKHTVFGLKEYYKVMGIKEPGGLVLPRVRKAKRLPRVLSQQQVALLLHRCELYDKTLLATIYDYALRVSEACSLKWIDINFDRQQLFVYQGKGKKDRCVPISAQLLVLLRIYKKRFPSDDFVFKSHGRGVEPQPIKPGYVRVIFKNALVKACLDHSLTIHSLRHSCSSHLLEMGENILSFFVQHIGAAG